MLRIRASWLGLVVLAIPACGPPPETIPTLAPGVQRTLKEDEANPAQAKGEPGNDVDTTKPTVGAEEQVTPPPVQPIAERTTPSGLKIAILQEGPGDEAKPGLATDVRYTAWVDGGRIFDSTQQKKALFHFVLGSGDALKGLDEGVVGMKKGERRRLTVPPALGYGEKGMESMKVPTNATLIYDVDLVGVSEPQGPVLAMQEVQPEMAPEVKAISERSTSSRLKIEVLQQGAGEEAKAGQSVSMHYTGWLLHGAKFDSSRDRGKLFPFVLGAHQVIEGWDEGIVGMKVGERRRLTIPPSLGYGSQSKPKIPADSTLVFDIELIGVSEGPPETATPAEPAKTDPATTKPATTEVPKAETPAPAASESAKPSP